MKTAQTRAQRTKQVQSLAILAMFTAIIFLLTFTPLGLIDLPVIKATVLHVPVIIGSILLGPKKGAFLGGMFGLSSMIKNKSITFPPRYLHTFSKSFKQRFENPFTDIRSKKIVIYLLYI